MFATIFGNLTAIIQRLYSTTSKYHKDLATVREFIHFYEIPSPLSDKLEDYTKNIWAQTKGVNVQKVIYRIIIYSKIFNILFSQKCVATVCMRCLY